MANYNSLKNAGIAKPTGNISLGSDSSRYTDIFLSGNVNIGSTSLTSTNAVAPRVTVITYPGNDTAANPAGGQTIILNGSGFQSGATVLVSGTIVDVVSFVSNIQLTFVSPAMDAGSYVLYVINPDGGTATSIPGIQYSGVPTWTTTAGSLGSSMESSAVTYTITATGDAPVTYSVFSGSLPAGLSLNSSTGVISGTTPAVESDTTYNFTIRATDAQNQDTDRAFSLTILAVTYTITPASSSVYEGSTLTFNVGGTGITNGTYYYTINNTTTAAADFSGSVTSGSFTITSNVGSFTVTPTADVTTEGAETFTVSLRTGSVSGTIVATSSTVTINDTSTAPAITPASSSVNEGSALTFNVYRPGINYAVDYWVINHITTTDADFSASSGEVTINSAYGSFTVTPTADSLTEGPQTFTVSLRDGPPGVGGWGTVIATSSTVTINDTSTTPPPSQRAIFGYGYNDFGGVQSAVTNKVSNTGVVATDTTGVGTARRNLAAAGYGTDKAIFGYGSTLFTPELSVSVTNLVSNTGVVASDTTGVGTARWVLAAAGYGTDKAIFGYGTTVSYSNTALTNLVSNTGVVATDTAGVGTARSGPAAAGYGTDKAIFGYGSSSSSLSITNLVSNAGVVANDTAGVGTARSALAAAGYGGDKAIFGYGYSTAHTTLTNKVSNTGVVATDTTGVGTARSNLAAAGYGGDKAIFGYGANNNSSQTISNLVSNTGVVATDTSIAGTSRTALAAAGYSTT